MFRTIMISAIAVLLISFCVGAEDANTASKTLLDQAGLNWTWGSARMERNETSVKVISTAGDTKGVASLASIYIKLVPGERYTISFKAKGDVNLIGMLSLVKKGEDKNNGRFDFMKPTQLGSEWKPFSNSFTFSVPEDVEKAGVSLHCWQQNGSFEIKDFKVTTP